MRHRFGVALARYWDALTAAWGRVTSGKIWQAEQRFYGVVGWLRAVEITHGEAGWHIHVHAVIVMDGPVSAELFAELGAGMFRRWERALARRGYSAVAERGGLDTRMLQLTGRSIDAAADYISKAAFEVASPATKDGRNGNRSPFAILADGLATGLADDLELWWEYETASHDRRQLTWSRDLRNWAGLRGERSDEEIAAADQHGSTLLMLPGETWCQVRNSAHVLLGVAEAGGIAAAQAWLDRRGLSWFLPTSAQERGL
jgi:hypothetical protein